MDTNNERLALLIGDLKRRGRVHNLVDFSRSIGKARTAISEMTRGVRPVTYKTAKAVSDAFPEVNAEWLTNYMVENAYVDGTTVEPADTGATEPPEMHEVSDINVTCGSISSMSDSALLLYIDRITTLLERQQTQIDLLIKIIASHD